MSIPSQIQSLERVLIVDDDEPTRRLLQMFFRDISRVDLAPGFDEALDHARSSRYDLVLMDMNLEGRSRSGMELLGRIRELEGYQQVPVIAITGHVMAADRREILDAGFDGHIAKPFTRGQLFEGVSTVLRGM